MEVGDKINRLTLIEKCKGKKSLFKCDCGNVKMINVCYVKDGRTKSCGCLFRERPNHTIHGDKDSRLYKIWKSMRERCNTSSSSNYKNYGARGISICTEWNNYLVFKEWALANGYNDALTIDRIDVNGNYCPANCRWATYKEQANNMRSNRNITYKGETKTLTQWAELYGIKPATLWNRLNHGWDIDDALNRPIKTTNIK